MYICTCASRIRNVQLQRSRTIKTSQQAPCGCPSRHGEQRPASAAPAAATGGTAPTPAQLPTAYVWVHYGPIMDCSARGYDATPHARVRGWRSDSRLAARNSSRLSLYLLRLMYRLPFFCSLARVRRLQYRCYVENSSPFSQIVLFLRIN